MHSVNPAGDDTPVPCEGFDLIGPLVAEEMLAVIRRATVREFRDVIDQAEAAAVALDEQ